MQLLNDLRKYNKLSHPDQIYLISFLTALSGVLSVLDTMIPKPLPFAKIGIANIVTLIMILEGQFQPALLVVVLRTVLSSVMVGTFLSYTFLLSFTGGIVSVLITWLFFIIFRTKLSEIGLSVVGAFFSTLAQGIVVMAFFGTGRGMLLLISVFLLIGTMNGIIIGFVARSVRKSIT